MGEAADDSLDRELEELFQEGEPEPLGSLEPDAIDFGDDDFLDGDFSDMGGFDG